MPTTTPHRTPRGARWVGCVGRDNHKQSQSSTSLLLRTHIITTSVFAVWDGVGREATGELPSRSRPGSLVRSAVPWICLLRLCLRALLRGSGRKTSGHVRPPQRNPPGVGRVFVAVSLSGAHTRWCSASGCLPAFLPGHHVRPTDGGADSVCRGTRGWPRPRDTQVAFCLRGPHKTKRRCCGLSLCRLFSALPLSQCGGPPGPGARGPGGDSGRFRSGRPPPPWCADPTAPRPWPERRVRDLARHHHLSAHFVACCGVLLVCTRGS